jgi:hypothetical protein
MGRKWFVFACVCLQSHQKPELRAQELSLCTAEPLLQRHLQHSPVVSQPLKPVLQVYISLHSFVNVCTVDHGPFALRAVQFASHDRV